MLAVAWVCVGVCRKGTVIVNGERRSEAWVSVFAIGLKTYWSEFPRLKERLERYRGR